MFSWIIFFSFLFFQRNVSQFRCTKDTMLIYCMFPEMYDRIKMNIRTIIGWWIVICFYCERKMVKKMHMSCRNSKWGLELCRWFVFLTRILSSSSPSSLAAAAFISLRLNEKLFPILSITAHFVLFFARLILQIFQYRPSIIF